MGEVRTEVYTKDGDLLGWVRNGHKEPGCDHANCKLALQRGKPYHAISRVGWFTTYAHHPTLADAMEALYKMEHKRTGTDPRPHNNDEVAVIVGLSDLKTLDNQLGRWLGASPPKRIMADSDVGKALLRINDRVAAAIEEAEEDL